MAIIQVFYIRNYYYDVQTNRRHAMIIVSYTTVATMAHNNKPRTKQVSAQMAKKSSCQPCRCLVGVQCLFQASFGERILPPPQKKVSIPPQTATKLYALSLFFGRDNELPI